MGKCDNEPCSKCKKNPRKVYSSGLVFSWCDECTREWRKPRIAKKREDNAGKREARVAERANVPCHNCGAAKRLVTSKGWVLPYCRECQRAFRRDASLWKAYKITATEYEDMLDAQGWKCPVCNEHFDEDNPPVIDHCHETGKTSGNSFRGVLHASCNSAIGMLAEQPDNFARAAAYVSEWHNKRKLAVGALSARPTTRKEWDRMTFASRVPGRKLRNKGRNGGS